jgi:hypothetical protein
MKIGNGIAFWNECGRYPRVREAADRGIANRAAKALPSFNIDNEFVVVINMTWIAVLTMP